MAKKNTKKNRPTKQTVSGLTATMADVNTAMVALGIKRVDERGHLVSGEMECLLTLNAIQKVEVAKLYKRMKK